MTKTAQKSIYLTDLCENYTFNVKIAIFCENMSEEGFESKFGSEEGLNLFRTLDIDTVHKHLILVSL